jgi:oligosaccharyltransferase complex subunit beta
MNKEGNIFIALSGGSPTSTTISSLLLELDLHLSPDRAPVVVDHFNYDTISAADQHDVLLLPRPTPVRSDLKDFFGGEGVVAFPRPAPQTLGTASPLLAPILRAPETAYSYDTKDPDQSLQDTFATGSQLALVSSFQARNSARLTVWGSLEALEDKWFNATVKGLNDEKETPTINREFARQVTAWTFQELGVLKVGRVEHYLTGGAADEFAISNKSRDLNPKIYRIKNDVVSSLSPVVMTFSATY